MPDWKRIVRERLQSSQMNVADPDSVVSELAAHLEETCEHARSIGLTDRAAIDSALQEVTDWQVLAKQIRRAKSEEAFVNHRTKALWLPALATFLSASVSLMLCQFLGMHPRIVRVGEVSMWFYWPWLATLPIFGGLGALLSHRARGHFRARLAAGLSPALIMLIVMLLILPWGLAIDGLHFLQLVSFGLGLLNWVALPGLALLLGALPFLRGSALAPPCRQPERHGNA